MAIKIQPGFFSLRRAFRSGNLVNSTTVSAGRPDPAFTRRPEARRCLALALSILWMVATVGAEGDDLISNFQHRPDSARPWVYWFPLDGNISSNGITADLEAMKRVGIG